MSERLTDDEVKALINKINLTRPCDKCQDNWMSEEDFSKVCDTCDIAYKVEDLLWELINKRKDSKRLFDAEMLTLDLQIEVESLTKDLEKQTYAHNMWFERSFIIEEELNGWKKAAAARREWEKRGVYVREDGKRVVSSKGPRKEQS